LSDHVLFKIVDDFGKILEVAVSDERVELAEEFPDGKGDLDFVNVSPRLF